MPAPSQRRRSEALRLAASGLSGREIARRLNMSRRTVLHILHVAEREGILQRLESGNGKPTRYDRGHAWREAAPTGVNGAVQILARAHHLLWRIPVFEHQLERSRGPDGSRPWSVQKWKGDYRAWTLNGGVLCYGFNEGALGSWVYIVPPAKRTVGKRVQVATLLLRPAEILMGARLLEDAETVEYAKVVELLSAIRRDRGLDLRDALPIRAGRSETEYGFPLEEDSSFPQGAFSLGPGIWVDRSRPGRRPELETNSAQTAQVLRLSLEGLRAAVDLPAQIAALRAEVRDLRDRLEAVERGRDGA